MTNWNWKYIGIGLAILFVMLGWPPTRALIVFILPLGRGVDDFLFWVVAAGAGIVWGGQWWTKWKAREDVRRVNKNKNRKVLYWTLTSIVLIMSLIIPPTGTPLQNWFLMGKPIQDPITFGIWLAVEGLAVLFIWLLLGRKERK